MEAAENEYFSISLAVNFNKRDDKLLTLAVDLCKRSGFRLQLVHVCEPLWRENITSLIDETALSDKMEELQAKKLTAAEKKLKQIQASVPPEVETSIKLESGSVTEKIVSAAIADNSYLIICGAAKGGYKLYPRGFSTPLALASQAAIPVLIVNDDSTVDFTKDQLNILLCDDLAPSSVPVVLFSFNFVARLQNSFLHHVHVQSVSINSIQTALTSLMSFFKDPKHVSLGYSEVIAGINKKLKRILDERKFDRVDKLTQAGGGYNAQILAGYTNEEIHNAIEKYDIDLVVFGRHEGFHRNPFYIGQVPLSMMLSLDKPIIIAPIIEK